MVEVLPFLSSRAFPRRRRVRRDFLCTNIEWWGKFSVVLLASSPSSVSLSQFNSTPSVVGIGQNQGEESSFLTAIPTAIATNERSDEWKRISNPRENVAEGRMAGKADDNRACSAQSKDQAEANSTLAMPLDQALSSSECCSTSRSSSFICNLHRRLLFSHHFDQRS